MNNEISLLKEEVKSNLVNNILPYWINNMADVKNGGFLGSISGMEVPDANSPKGAILNARILWTFSAAYRILKDPVYL